MTWYATCSRSCGMFAHDRDSAWHRARHRVSLWGEERNPQPFETNQRSGAAWLGAFALFLAILGALNPGSTAAAIAQRGTATTGTTATSSLTINTPAGVVSGDVMIVDITQIGNSQGIILDAALMDLARLKVGDEVNITLHEGGSLIISPMRPVVTPEEAAASARSILAANSELFERLSH